MQNTIIKFVFSIFSKYSCRSARTLDLISVSGSQILFLLLSVVFWSVFELREFLIQSCKWKLWWGLVLERLWKRLFFCAFETASNCFIYRVFILSLLAKWVDFWCNFIIRSEINVCASMLLFYEDFKFRTTKIAVVFIKKTLLLFRDIYKPHFKRYSATKRGNTIFSTSGRRFPKWTKF